MKKYLAGIAMTAAMCLILTGCGGDKAESTAASPTADTTTTAAEAKELTPIDPFQGLSVVFNGESGSGTVNIEYTGDNEFLKNEVRYVCDTPNADKLSNGDVISISARCTPKVSSDNGYELTVTEKEYTVSELGGYITSPDGYDFSELDSKLEAAFLEGNWQKVCGVGNTINDHELEKDWVTVWQINSGDFSEYANKLIEDNSATFDYYKIYKFDLDCEKIDGLVMNPNSSYEVGAKMNWSGFAVIYAHNVYVENHSVLVKSEFENDINIIASYRDNVYFCRDEAEFNEKFEEWIADKENGNSGEVYKIYDIK